MRIRSAAPSALLLAVVALVSGCGQGVEADGATPTVPTVADQRFDGEYRVGGVDADGDPIAPAAAATIDIDTVYGRLTVNAGCNTYYGSFTLDGGPDEGRASFTVPGGTAQSCPDAVTAQETTVLGVLDAVSRWRATPEGWELDSDQGDRLELSR